MKISSASKKVLASALSAAMVVAFAPTVAFGAVNDPITINVNANGGTATQTSFTGFKQGGTITLPGATKDGYSVDKWFVDDDGDGVKSEDESYATGATADDDGEAGDSFTLPNDKAEVTIAAEYKIPGTSLAYDKANKKFTVQNTGTTYGAKQHTYKLTVTNPNGTVLTQATYAPTNTTDPNATAAISADAIELVFGAGQINPELLVAGTYTAVLTDNGNAISTKTVKLVNVTLKDAAGAVTSEDLYDLNAKGKATVNLTSNYVNEAGYLVSGNQTITGDAVFQATAATISATSRAYNEGTRTLSFTVTDSAAAVNGDKYAVSVVDPNGTEVFSGAAAAGASVAFSFDTASAAAHAAASEVAGSYAINITKTAGGTGVVTTTKTEFKLSEVKFDAGTGSFKDTFKGADVFTDELTLVDDNAALSYEGYLSKAQAALKAPEGYGFQGWKVDGKAYVDAATSLKAGKVNVITAAYTAEGTKVATPTFTIETKATDTNKYVIKVSCTTPGAEIFYGDTDAPATAYNATDGIEVAKNSNAAIYIQAKYAAGKTDPSITVHSTVVKLTKNAYAKAFADATSGVASKLELGIGYSSDKWLGIEGIKAAAESGNAALQGLGVYYTDEDAAAAADKAAYKALYEAVLAGATAEIDKYANGAPVVVGTKVYEMTTADKAAADKAVADLAKGVAAAESVKGETAATYKNAADEVITKANAGLKTAKESKTYTVADITAAQDVVAQLAAATTGEAAEAALKAYAALTDAQKKLVATADVAKAEAVVAEAKAAAELVAAQDDAAVSKTRNASKTVKLAKGKTKTTKKQSVTLKAITSASGAKVTYKKSSGSSKVTVKSGKAYLAKGVKKGSYKATVKATCGTQTAKITVTFKVK